MKGKRIALLSPWYGGSHKRWADGLKAASRHQIDIFPLPARHWKWRMHGAAVNLAEQVLSSNIRYDLILADDMMDVAVFRVLIRNRYPETPLATYFHENQVCYPVSGRDTDIAYNRDLHYGYVNFTSCLASDRIFFNSNFHRREFLGALPGLLSSFPDGKQDDLVPVIARKSEVLPLGMDLGALDSFNISRQQEKQRPLILWNHRWEYDKQPHVFFRLLLELHQAGHDFDIALLGERGVDKPEGYEAVQHKLHDRIMHDGEVQSIETYANWLWQADIVPVTAIHDFFGTSVVEALYCRCHVILPDRLAYPEHVDSRHGFYSRYEELLEKTRDLISSGRWRDPSATRNLVKQYDWESMIECYDSWLESIETNPSTGPFGGLVASP